ncbi:PREDICTED: phosphoacetylglucosamine mutase-like [Priapulus caudatus]|uniref:Phosphoacetylglucosamine mutase n=1 Tax=Priapulus caudatus TaxID=37621 RepID=A0ABM1EZ84_PRICU|nr:PREDICTED: phosphoacetylglucosamine mutase-like [Priapulus caudatus]
MEEISSVSVILRRNIFSRRTEKTFNFTESAGFRGKAVDLDWIVFRVGLLSVLYSKYKKATVGVMITASHNPEPDNGVKVVGPMGEMMEGSWELSATELINSRDEDLELTLQQTINNFCIDATWPASVYFARDTRPSSPMLAEALCKALEMFHCTVKDYGILSTPQLHYMVRCDNTHGSYGVPTEAGYYEKLSKAFLAIMQPESNKGQYIASVMIDGANGVGALKAADISKYLKHSLSMSIFNDGSHGKLNYKCGADHVKVSQTAPEGVPVELAARCLSFDGDADRVVYYYIDEGGKFSLLDGDKIATLVAGFLNEMVVASGLNLKLGVVQTAYANGSSTNYISNVLKVPVSCVSTGVKHLHHRAADYDVGVYFEANGHGTVLFSDKAFNMIRKISNAESGDTCQKEAADKLLSFVDVVNQTVGDAISDMLLVEAILHERGWSIQQWNDLYNDLPNRQMKVKVRERTVIVTTDAERKTTAPAGLQDRIDEIVSKYPVARAFVRPSGTEDIVRVYAESDTQEKADSLACKVAQAVYDMAGGDGDRPAELC